MEKINKFIPSRKKFKDGVGTLALCGILAFGNTSCGKPTSKDVMEQEKKVENISRQISYYITARKNYVEKYNKIFKYPKSDSNKYDINESLMQLSEVISDYDDKIAYLSKDKDMAIVKLDERRGEVGTGSTFNGPIDPDRWDYLLIE